MLPTSDRQSPLAPWWTVPDERGLRATEAEGQGRAQVPDQPQGWDEGRVHGQD